MSALYNETMNESPMRACGCERRGLRMALCSYHQGHADGAAEERAAVVAWMRSAPVRLHQHSVVSLQADAIERGDHVKKEK